MNKYLPIGERLRKERERLGCNQTVFADVAGITRKTLFGYETGVRPPDAAVLAVWGEMGLDVLYVITGQDSKAVITQPVLSTPLHDRERLRIAIETVEEGLADMHRKLQPKKRAELILAAYDLLAEPERTRATIIQLVRAVA